MQAYLKPVTPDHIVYCKARPLLAGNVAILNNKYFEYKNKNGNEPRIIIIKGFGFLRLEQMKMRRNLHNSYLGM